MKKTLLKIALAGLVAFPTISAVQPAQAATDTTKAILSFPVVSDVHINWQEKSVTKFKKVLEDLNKINPNADTLIINGDLTSAGTDAEYDKLNQVLASVPHAPVNMTIGNHEFYKAWYNDNGEWAADSFPNGEMEKMSIDRFLKKTGAESLYYDKWINDHHFIFLGSEQYRQSNPTNGEDAYLSDEQLKWLEGRLADKARADKPIFVFLHQPIPYTVSGTESYINNRAVIQHERLMEILSQYPQVVYFSGHTHWTLNMASTMFQKDFTMFNSSTTWDPLNNKEQSLGPDESEGLYVEVFDDKVVVKGRDFFRQKWIEGQEYVIPITPVADLVDYDFAESATKDSSPAGNHGTAVGNPKVQFDALFQKNVLLLDGSSYVRIPDNAGLRPKEITLAASFSLDSVEGGYQDVVAKNQTSDYGFEFNPGTKKLEAWMYIKTADSAAYVVTETPALEANRKYDVAVTYNGEEVVMYLDGVKVQSKEAVGELSQAADPVDLAIGVDPEVDGGARSYMTGKIGYVKVYSKALTEEQITGVSKVKDVISPVWSNGSKLSGSNLSQTGVDLSWTAAADNEGVAKYRVYKDGKVFATVGGDVLTTKVTGLSPKTAYTFKVEAADDAGNWTTNGPSVKVTTKGRVFAEVSAPDLLNMDFSQSATHDASPAGNHGIVEGNAKVEFDSVMKKNALVLDGNGSIIRIKDNDGLRPQFMTLAAAFSLDALDTTQDIIAKNQSSDYGFEFNPGSGKLESWTWIQTETGAEYVVLQTGQLEANKVYHVAMTFDGEENALYVNGLKVDSKAVKGVIAQNVVVDVAIGADPEVDNGARSFLKGKVYLAQIYSKALTEGQIQTLSAKFFGTDEDGGISENPTTGDKGVMNYILLALVSALMIGTAGIQISRKRAMRQ